MALLRNILSALALLLVSTHAFAQQAANDVQLRTNIAASGTNITLGDVFDNAGSAANVVLARAPAAGQRVVFSAQTLQARANIAGLNWRNREGVRDVVIEGNGANVQTNAGRATNNAANMREVAVLTRNLARGEVVSAADLEWMDVANAPQDAVTDADILVGMTARRNLVAHQALRPADFSATHLVRRGEMVTLVYEAGAVRITLRGRAMANGARGDVVRVTNLSSNRVVEAIVTAENTARVTNMGQMASIQH